MQIHVFWYQIDEFDWIKLMIIHSTLSKYLYIVCLQQYFRKEIKLDFMFRVGF